MHDQQPDPLRSPVRGCSMYAVHIYNRVVRELVKQNRAHDTLSERWAEEQTHEVCADNAEEARTLAATRFPPSEGFVITSVTEAPMH